MSDSAGASSSKGTPAPIAAYTAGGMYMKIIKRNGAEVPFDITKIITAVTKASDSVGG